MAKTAPTHAERARKATNADISRMKLMRAVRAACRRLGIDDDARKDIQAEQIKKASMSDMSIGELGKLLDHLNRDWKGPMGHRAHLGKIKALWWSLYWLGAIDDPGERPISSFVQRQTGISALNFLDHRKAASVIEALKSWAAREGVSWHTPEQEADYAAHAPDLDPTHYDRFAVLEALERKLKAKGMMFGSYVDYLRSALRLVPNHHYWTTAELDAGIRLLGRKHRRAMGKGES
ncbi:regulatory protein GemA [Sphingobium aquiterrae]|uniref:regulatory protein GemA n=1 Tax=Sphingobium aquiterrae TaxID=2038656 RepID=UPI003019504C